MSCSTSQKKYDVFISFRGEDMRETFTSHLHYVLYKQNIITYIDDNLIKGDEIGSALSQAIQDSRISLIIFSKNYATSKWCLNELLKILECRKFHGQVVIPVFYNIDPSDLRKQTGSYGEAFAKYEREVMNNNESFANTVSQWRIALAEVANIPGWDSQSRTHK
ncbi:hypothetical protein TSUD_357230 [Trifolium subterraneum]|uniref:TIR domain-containing protein n=1 Tax=Trifolium subterraneum TaxID=3900 RepID=A0A2Z6MMY8_TRISU|nr:hypothetical protein TSUD_357230 [Trifolium subterraneum]